MLRRSFMSRLGRMIGILGFAGLPYGLARLLAPGRSYAAQQPIPLPGALVKENEFVAACIGCGLCGEVCPPRCVEFHKSDAGAKANTPYINPARRGCTLCGLCMEACPTEALTITPPRKVKMGIAQIDRVACYPWVDRGICGACVGICPLGESAIGFDFGNIYRPVVKEGCVGCGLCVEVCPEPSLPIRIVGRGQPTVAQHGVGIRRQSYH